MLQKVLIVGATGPLGRAVVTAAIARELTVTAFVRDPLLAKFPDDVRLAKGNVLNPNSLSEAVKGQDAVLCALGSKLTLRPITMLSEGTKNLISTMTENGAKRLICVTGIGAGDSRGHGGFLYDWVLRPLLLREIYKDKTRQEEILKASNLDWTIIRPSILTNGLAKKSYRIATKPDGFTGRSIARADVAGFMVNELLESNHVRESVLVSD